MATAIGQVAISKEVMIPASMLEKVRQQEQAKQSEQLDQLRAEQARQAKAQQETLAQLEKLTKLLTERQAAPAPAPTPEVKTAPTGGLKVPAGGRDRRRSAMMEHVPELDQVCVCVCHGICVCRASVRACMPALSVR